MPKQISIFLFIFFTSICALAQTENYNAPVKWERYKVSEREVSVLFPKLPTLAPYSNICSQEETNKYTVYAENVVYGLNITSKAKQPVPNFCADKKNFDEKNFNDRLSQLKSELKSEKETKFNQNGLEVVKIENESFAYWLINDLANKRWFELWTTDAGEANINTKNFAKSLKMEKNPSGIEIGKGSSRVLGDETTADKIASEEKSLTNTDKETVGIRIIVKQPPPYTEAARKAQNQGTVRLRVTFLATGGIGDIRILNALPNGLTEQAIAAAAKIAFIPAKSNGTPITVVKQVEYSFRLF
ncbi:MAG: energy transducer TonB [Acidobacteriota bacterium]|nr:energy transducer TonB [Acidobacteriota bacterium]